MGTSMLGKYQGLEGKSLRKKGWGAIRVDRIKILG
jgi:hypothetical protein